MLVNQLSDMSDIGNWGKRWGTYKDIAWSKFGQLKKVGGDWELAVSCLYAHTFLIKWILHMWDTNVVRTRFDEISFIKQKWDF